MNGNSWTGEVEMQNRDGHLVDILLRADAIKDDNGKIIGLVGIHTDITEKKKIEERYRNMIELFPDGIMTVNKKGVVTSCNPAFLKLTGFSKEEIVGKNVLRLPTITIKSKLMMAGKLKTLMKGDIPEPFDFEWKRKDGSIRIGNAKIGLMKKNDKLQGFQAILRDVTDDKIAERKIKESEERYRSLFEGSLDLVYINDFKGNFIDANKTSFDLLGYSKEEIKNLNFMTLLDKGQLRKALKISREVMKNGYQKEPYEFRLRCKDGSFVDIETTSSLIYHEGKAIAMQGIARDITEKKKAERELHKTHEKLQYMNIELEKKVEERTFEINKLLKQKDEFISQLGHDLKNPLNPLVNLLPIVLKREQDMESKELLEAMVRNVGYMKNLVIKTIQLARLNVPNTKFSIENINLLYIVNNVLEKHQIIFDETHIGIENKIYGNIIVKADKLRLEELFDNLINNAVKYSPNGGKITIDGKEDKEFITISIEDTGLGMNKEQLNHIFDEFYKADKARHDFDSSGLGLPICKRIVEKQGGKIWAESSGLGKGSTFNFTIQKGRKIIIKNVSK